MARGGVHPRQWARKEVSKVKISPFQMVAPSAKGQYPLFVVQEGRSSDLTCGESDQAGQVLKIRHVDSKGRIKPSSSRESDDFVFL